MGLENYNTFLKNIKIINSSYLLLEIKKKFGKKSFIKRPNCNYFKQGIRTNKFINKCSVFISMDSANMHLASLTTTPVYHLGPTHPFLGFGPLFNEHLIVQLIICLVDHVVFMEKLKKIKWIVPKNQ